MFIGRIAIFHLIDIVTCNIFQRDDRLDTKSTRQFTEDICLQVSFLEEWFVRSLGVSVGELEPVAEDCTKVWVWHTRTERAATPRLEHISDSHWQDTNLPVLYSNLYAK